MPAMQHHLLFYESNATLEERVADFARDGLSSGEVVILIATPDHLDGVATRLDASGFDVAKASALGALHFLDAADTLAQFTAGGRVDAQLFDITVGALVRAAAASGKPVRAFGEMVALLWDAGRPTAAAELEELWNNLAAEVSFDLLCAYPANVLAGNEDWDHVNLVCELHDDVALGAKGAQSTRLRSYPPVRSAVSAARHFVGGCVSERATPAAKEDALLIASELSANAVYHARSSFAVELSWHDDMIRIGVRDAYHGRPKMYPVNLHSGSGRGVAMIDAISARWGIESHARGKTVWAEIPALDLRTAGSAADQDLIVSPGISTMSNTNFTAG